MGTAILIFFIILFVLGFALGYIARMLGDTADEVQKNSD